MRRIGYISIAIFILLLGSSTSFARTAYESQNKEPGAVHTMAVNSITPPEFIGWPTFYGTHVTDEVIATFNCFGNLGLSFGSTSQLPYWPPFSFGTPVENTTEYLFGGAVWIGGIVGKDTLVSVGHDGWYPNFEFRPPFYDGTSNSKGSVNKFDYLADLSLRAEFSDTSSLIETIGIYDRPHKPLNLSIAQRSYSWKSGPASFIIIYDLVATNVGQEAIKDGYIGLYFDIDVGRNPSFAPYDDLAGSIKEYGIGYMIDNDGDYGAMGQLESTRILAAKFLANSFDATDSNFSWWASNGDTSHDYGPRLRGTVENPFRDFGTGGLGTPMGDRNKYYVMKFPEWDFDQVYLYDLGLSDSIWIGSTYYYQTVFGADSRILMSLGPFDLLPDSSIRVLYATITADSVVTDINNFDNLPDFPDDFLSNIPFDKVIANSLVADSLCKIHLDPLLPPIGIKTLTTNDSELELHWDPWAFKDVTGYKIYVYEPDLSNLPVPGAIPPWWEVPASVAAINIGKTYKYDLSSLEPKTRYLISVANSTGKEIGKKSKAISVRPLNRDPAPAINSKYVFKNSYDPIAIELNYEDKSNLDHYNIYKFEQPDGASSIYHRFYDEGYYSQFVKPVQTFDIGSKRYYYYAMEPYAQVSASDTMFYDNNIHDGNTYIITAVDQFGFESEFTEPIEASIVAPMTRDVLALTNGSVHTAFLLESTSEMIDFYDSVLSGLDYAIYSHRDTMAGSPDCASASDFAICMDWHDFAPFKLLIIDDRLFEVIMTNQFEGITEKFEKYISYGGKVAYFGSFVRIDYVSFEDYSNEIPINNYFVNHTLGINSHKFLEHNIGGVGSEYEDTLFAFINALNVNELFPPLNLDTLRDPFNSRYHQYWGSKSPPYVTTFGTNEFALPIYLHQSIYPDISLQHGQVIGTFRDLPEFNTEVYAFGFHLWYMNMTDARSLIETILNGPSANWIITDIEPSKLNSLEALPLGDTAVQIYCGFFTNDIDVGEIEPASLVINNAIVPGSISIESSRIGYAGSVLRLNTSYLNLLQTYGFVLDTLQTKYSVSGMKTGGEPFQTEGTISIIGRLRRDVSGDGLVDILDLNFIIGHLFRSQPLPENYQPETMDSDGVVNLLDLNELVNYLFRPAQN